LPGLRIVQAGLLWLKFRKQYPKASEQPPIAPAFETFGAAIPVQPMLQFETLLVPPVPRFWFETEDGTHLVQVQQDRFIHNWRERQPGDRYPRYDKLRVRFRHEVERFEEFVGENDIGSLGVNQCEITYFNTIQLTPSDDPHGQLSDITPLWSGQHSGELPGDLENATVQARYLMTENGDPVGRIYVSFRPVLKMPDFTRAIQLEITARGRPRDPSVDGAFDMLDFAHASAVRTFAAVTSPKAQSLWGRE
jgi:uncharacterized protein (TIGR04255 family)